MPGEMPYNGTGLRKVLRRASHGFFRHGICRVMMYGYDTELLVGRPLMPQLQQGFGCANVN